MAKRSRKFLLEFNNPSDEDDYNYKLYLDKLNSRSGLKYACFSTEIGSETHRKHIHCFCIYSDAKSWDSMRKLTSADDIQCCRGSCEQNRDYVFKSGKWAHSEKADTNLPNSHYEWGEPPTVKEIPTKEAELLEIIQQNIDDGMTPREILAQSVSFYKYQTLIRKAYFDKRYSETPYLRDVTVHYHVGNAGSGKSYVANQLIEKNGEDSVYVVTDYANGGTASFDGYNGESVLFLDEFKSSIPYHMLLIITDRYKADIHCRYANTYALWTEIHISSIFPPEELYKGMVEESERKRDSIQQFFRRISTIVYHKKQNDDFLSYEMPMADYISYSELKKEAETFFMAHGCSLSVSEDIWKGGE